MVRIEHPRAARGKQPPATVSYAQRGRAAVDDEGYFEIPEKYAPGVMQSLARKYDVEFDDGEVILPDGPADQEDEPPDESDTTTSAEDEPSDDGDEFDLEAFLDDSYTDRADAVAAGEVDAHLDAIEDAETSQTVTDAIETRRDELAEE